MKFEFKIQEYQTEAVKSVIDVFKGQPKTEGNNYIRDLGVSNYILEGDLLSGVEMPEDLFHQEDNAGYNNAHIMLKNSEVLENIKSVQTANNIKLSSKLEGDLGVCTLDIEMETGTGKTYVYTKTIFELNKIYGWTKFIVVVPSIAIREGVFQSIKNTEDHFMEYYGKKIRYFIYDSKNLTRLDSFSSDASINVMIINIQAFNTRGADSRRIYDKLDSFASRRPIDVIAANNPILILDEPQKMGGEATQTSLKQFKPLFSINYSATHQKQNNLVYVLDALDAYNKKLVKKIEVKGFELKNLSGINEYMYLEDIIISPDNPPKAKIEIEVKNKAGNIKRQKRIFNVQDKLIVSSNNLDQYKGYTISNIDPKVGSVSFTNGNEISIKQISGDVTEKNMRRIQIRETIKSHFEKEEELFNMGIKTLSLFFIDEVAKYRVYDDNGNEKPSEYLTVFEEEYETIKEEYINNKLDMVYIDYLKGISIKDTHKGYFSVDKKGRITNSSTKRNSEDSDDISAYDLILKDKKRLLSFDEPTRFIFSHSALREGWDNPNVFQICTLKHSDSTTLKRQEVGRGLRLCVNKDGYRIDSTSNPESVHKINKLTVVASESYIDFVGGLQKEMKDVLYDRPSVITIDYFIDKKVKIGEETVTITKEQAGKIYSYLNINDYIDGQGNITTKYYDDKNKGVFEPLPSAIKNIEVGIHKLVQSIFDSTVMNDMFDDGNKTKLTENRLNNNFKKAEFQALWNKINNKYAYTVKFNSSELIKKVIDYINTEVSFNIAPIQYLIVHGQQKENLNTKEIESGDSFETIETSTGNLNYNNIDNIKYDLVGKIADGTKLTRKSTVEILKGIKVEYFNMFKNNPEEFISKIIKLVDSQKASVIIDKVIYNRLEDKYDTDIFNTSKADLDFKRAFEAKKHIQDYVITDNGGGGINSVERKFAEDLEKAKEVCVYAKLPRSFKIPTPVGNYTPDWAISFNKGEVKYTYFIAETKGTNDDMELRSIENAKIKCAKRLFNEMSSEDMKYDSIHYDKVTSYQDLMNMIKN